MDIKTLRTKTQKNLQKELDDAQAHLRDLEFKSSVNQLKNVRDIRETKKTIARILTLLNTAKQEPATPKE